MDLEKLGLHSRPFAFAPDSAMMVWTQHLEQVRDRIRVAVAAQEPLIVLTGILGSGKSTFLIALMDDLSDIKSLDIVVLWGAMTNRDDMLNAVAQKVAHAPSDKLDPVASIVESIVRCPTLLIIDEAQSTSPEAVKTLYKLAEEHGQLTILLAGQSELLIRLAGLEYDGLVIPAAHRHSLIPLTETEAQIYIAARIEKAGGRPELILPDAAAYIAKVAHHVPREINKVADACIVLANIEGHTPVDLAFARRIVRDNLDPRSLALRTIPDAISIPANLDDYRPRKSPPDPPDLPTNSFLTLDEDSIDLEAVLQLSINANGSEQSRPVAFQSYDTPIAPAVTAKKTGRRYALPLIIACCALAGVTVFFVTMPDSELERSASAMELSDVGAEATVTEQDFTGAVDAVSNDPDTRQGLTTPLIDFEDAKGLTTTLDRPDEAPPGPVNRLAVNSIGREPDVMANELYSLGLSSDDPRQAAVAYARAALHGHKRAARYLSQKYEMGDGVTFSQAMAQRWNAVAADEPLGENTLEQTGSTASPIMGILGPDGLELVWDGVGKSFDVELAGEDQAPVADFTTSLTAAIVPAPNDVRFWRVRVADGPYSPWATISSE